MIESVAGFDWNRKWTFLLQCEYFLLVRKGINCLPWAMLTIPLSDRRKRFTAHTNWLGILCIENMYVICPYLFAQLCFCPQFPHLLWRTPLFLSPFLTLLIKNTLNEIKERQFECCGCRDERASAHSNFVIDLYAHMDGRSAMAKAEFRERRLTRPFLGLNCAQLLLSGRH